MKVSVFTPSHAPEHLPEMWGCLQEQTHTDWEWLVVANGDNARNVLATVERLAQGDSRVKTVVGNTSNVGALKRTACDSASGDLFLEYDHDDLITHDCLETVVQAARACPKACFIYSDDVTCEHDGGSNGFVKENGCQHYAWEYKGRRYTANARRAPHARSLCETLYSPDHVRVWSRTAYQMSGGHNPELPIGNDHELTVRTYLQGVHFHHIKRPLYIHRLKPSATSPQAVSEMQMRSYQTRDRYLHELVREWCRRLNLPMYDLGGAHNCPHGYIPVDANPAVSSHPQGICCDIFDLHKHVSPNSVGCFRASDFLEHVPGPQVPKLFNMLYDLLAPGGFFLTMTPAVCDDAGRAGRGAYQDPTHISFWSSNNFWYYCNRQFAKYLPEYRGRFQIVRLFNWYPSDWHRQHLIPYVCADLCAIKPENEAGWPGIVEI